MTSEQRPLDNSDYYFWSQGLSLQTDSTVYKRGLLSKALSYIQSYIKPFDSVFRVQLKYEMKNPNKILSKIFTKSSVTNSVLGSASCRHPGHLIWPSAKAVNKTKIPMKFNIAMILRRII